MKDYSEWITRMNPETLLTTKKKHLRGIITFLMEENQKLKRYHQRLLRDVDTLIENPDSIEAAAVKACHQLRKDQEKSTLSRLRRSQDGGYGIYDLIRHTTEVKEDARLCAKTINKWTSDVIDNRIMLLSYQVTEDISVDVEYIGSGQILSYTFIKDEKRIQIHNVPQPELHIAIGFFKDNGHRPYEDIKDHIRYHSDEKYHLFHKLSPLSSIECHYNRQKNEIENILLIVRNKETPFTDIKTIISIPFQRLETSLLLIQDKVSPEMNGQPPST